jgi:hypothetical protein
MIAGILLLKQQKPATRPVLNPAPKEQIPPTAVPPNQSTRADVPSVDIAGKWNANVKYDWGDSYKEIFEFEVDGNEISGMAGFLGDREGDGRAILDGKIAGNRISFMTKSLVVMGFDKPYAEDKHDYKGTVEGETIRFSMVTDSSVQSHAPIHFTAKKVKAGPLRQ